MMDGAFRTRTAALLVALVMVSTACGSSGASAPEVGDDTAESASSDSTSSDSIDPDRNPAAAAAQVFDAINAEADALVEPNVQHIKRQFFDGMGLESNIVLCEEVRVIRAGTVAALPAEIGDIRVEDLYATWKAAYGEFVTAHAANCDRIREEKEILEADDYKLHREASEALEEVGMAAELACIEAIGAFSEYGFLNCGRESDVQPSIDLGELADTQTNDADPLAGSTGGAGEPWVELPPGPAELAWFPRPFTIDHPESLNLQAEEDYIWITETPDGSTFEMYAIDELADPAQLTPFEVVATIPFPDDLTEWFDALPVTVTSTTEVEIGGSPATRWEFTPDRDATVDATGDVTAALARSAVHEWVVIDSYADPPERRVIWHVRAPSGPVLVYVIDAGFGNRPFAESVLPSITFG